jgi:hypothetical protein
MDQKNSLIKKCNHCLLEKEISLFTKNKSAKSGIGGHCLKCESIRTKNKRLKNPRSAREIMLRNKYGISEGVYLDLLVAQNDKCKICMVPAKDLDKPLYVDHCHTSGLIRGLLCHFCNSGLGYFKDDMATLLQAAEYLKRSKPKQS